MSKAANNKNNDPLREPVKALRRVKDNPEMPYYYRVEAVAELLFLRGEIVNISLNENVDNDEKS